MHALTFHWVVWIFQGEDWCSRRPSAPCCWWSLEGRGFLNGWEGREGSWDWRDVEWGWLTGVLKWMLDRCFRCREVHQGHHCLGSWSLLRTSGFLHSVGKHRLQARIQVLRFESWYPHFQDLIRSWPQFPFFCEVCLSGGLICKHEFAAHSLYSLSE